MSPVDHVHFSHATLHHVGAADHGEAQLHHASGDPLSDHVHSGAQQHLTHASECPACAAGTNRPSAPKGSN